MIIGSRLDNLIEESMKAASVPGLALAILHNGETLYSKGFGVTSVEDGGLPVTPQTIFRIGSISKALTGTVAMRLVEKGLLELDKPIVHYIPWFQVSDPLASSKITVRMLLSHTSGLPTGETDKNGKRDNGGLEETIKDLPNHPLMFFPGKTWCYSDKGIDVMGYVIEVVTGKRFEQAMRELVFEPLNMTRTTFDPLLAMTYPFAHPHVEEDNKMAVLHQPIENTGEHASGFAMSTVTDMARFALVHMGENASFLSSGSIEEMRRLHGDYYMPNDSGYGLTFEVETYKGIRRIWHDGAISSYCSWLYMAPDQGLAVIVLSNWRKGFWTPAIDLINTIFDELLQLPEEQEPLIIEADQTLWPHYTGSYIGPWIGIAKVAIEENGIVIVLNDEKIKLHCYRKDLYIGKDNSGEQVSIGFLLKNGTPVTDVMINGIPCERVFSDNNEFVTDPIAFAGTYISMNDELTFRVEEERLYCYDRYDDEEFICNRAKDRLFNFSSNVVEFLMDDKGKAHALRLNKTRLFPKKEIQAIIDRQ